MKVLVINCGSSSLKYQMIDSETEQVLAKGLCERIAIEGSMLTPYLYAVAIVVANKFYCVALPFRKTVR